MDNTIRYLHSIPPHAPEHTPAQQMIQLCKMGATPLGALWVIERKATRKFKRTIERLER